MNEWGTGKLHWCPFRRRRANDECHQARPSMLQRSKTSPLALAKLLRVGGSASLDPRSPVTRKEEDGFTMAMGRAFL